MKPPPVEFEAVAQAERAKRARYLLTAREAYVLRSAPIRGLRALATTQRRGLVQERLMPI
jgi:hypothetical protein